DPADRGIDSEAAAAEADRPARPGGRPDTRPEVKIDFDRMDRRARQLTRSGDAIREVAVAPDSRSVAFVTGGVEGGRQVQSIWSVTFEGERVTRLQQSTSQPDEEGGPPAFGRGGAGYSSLQYAKDGRTLFYRQNRGIYGLPVAAAPATTAQSPAAGGFGGRGGRGGRGAPGGGGAAVAAADTPTSTARRVNFTAKVEID